MTNWFHHLLTENVALAPQSALILDAQNMVFEGILCGTKHSCCFVSGCRHIAQSVKCIDIFAFLPGIQQQNDLPCCSDTTVKSLSWKLLNFVRLSAYFTSLEYRQTSSLFG